MSSWKIWDNLQMRSCPNAQYVLEKYIPIYIFGVWSKVIDNNKLKIFGEKVKSLAQRAFALLGEIGMAARFKWRSKISNLYITFVCLHINWSIY